MWPNFYAKSTIPRVLLAGLVILMGVFFFGSSCQEPAPPPAPALDPMPTTIEADISGFAFVPDTITVAVGTTITWTNKDSAPHTVSSRDGVFESGTMSRNATFSYTFEQSGTFEYYCKFHPYMTAKIIVE